MVYEVLYFSGWGEVPTYYLVDSAEGDTPEQALAENLNQLTQKVRKEFGLSTSDVRDEIIQETLYVLRADGLVSVRDVKRLCERRKKYGG